MVLSSALLFAGFVGGVLELVTTIMRSSDVYKTAVQRAENSPLVAEKIGRPFKIGWFTSGNINVSGDSGNADLSIPISGQRGSGRILVGAKKRHGKWTYQTLEVEVDGDEATIPLLTPDGGKPSPSGDLI
jgi:hypothetical protein